MTKKKEVDRPAQVLVSLDDLALLSRVIPHETGDLLADAGHERYYSSKQFAKFFDRSVQWTYYAEENFFFYPDGSPIRPKRDHRGWRLWTLPVMRDCVGALYQRNIIGPETAKGILTRILVAEAGGELSEVLKLPIYDDGEPTSE